MKKEDIMKDVMAQCVDLGLKFDFNILEKEEKEDMPYITFREGIKITINSTVIFADVNDLDFKEDILEIDDNATIKYSNVESIIINN